ncbi:MAG: hypothetical protein HKN71_03155 [Gemmatimonadetes bacterium]|nr:hypothetical protein [Gemmatimonadota bacterium]
MAVTLGIEVRPRAAPCGPRAVVLPVALLLLLAATLLIHGSVVVSSALLRGGDEAWAAVQVRRAAGGAATRAALGGPPSNGWVVADRVDLRVVAHALSPEVTLFEGRASASGATWAAGRLRWRADPRVRASEGASIRWGGRLTRVGTSTRLEAASDRSCGLAVGPALQGALGPDGVRIGPLDADGLAALLPRGDPRTGCAGVCPVAAMTVAGPLRLATGSISGLLLVRGDLELDGDVHVRGVLLVEGDLRILGSARVEGAVQVQGDLALEHTASLVGDACTVASTWHGGVADRVGPVLLEPAPWALWGGTP